MLLGLLVECLSKELLYISEHDLFEVVYFCLYLFLEQRNYELELFDLYLNCIQMLVQSTPPLLLID